MGRTAFPFWKNLVVWVMIQIHAHTTSGSNDAKVSSFGPPPVLQIGRRLPYLQTCLNEELVLTILRVSFAMQPGSRRRQYRLQRRNEHHASELKTPGECVLVTWEGRTGRTNFASHPTFVASNIKYSRSFEQARRKYKETFVLQKWTLRVISRSELKFVKNGSM